MEKLGVKLFCESVIDVRSGLWKVGILFTMDEPSWRAWWRFAVEEEGIGTCTAARSRPADFSTNQLPLRDRERVTLLRLLRSPGDANYPSGLFLAFAGYAIGTVDGRDLESPLPVLAAAGTVEEQGGPSGAVCALTSVHVPPGYKIIRMPSTTQTLGSLAPQQPDPKTPVASWYQGAAEIHTVPAIPDSQLHTPRAIAPSEADEDGTSSASTTYGLALSSQPKARVGLGLHEKELPVLSNEPLTGQTKSVSAAGDGMKQRDPTLSIYDAYFGFPNDEMSNEDYAQSPRDSSNDLLEDISTSDMSRVVDHVLPSTAATTNRLLDAHASLSDTSSGASSSLRSSCDSMPSTGAHDQPSTPGGRQSNVYVPQHGPSRPQPSSTVMTSSPLSYSATSHPLHSRLGSPVRPGPPVRQNSEDNALWMQWMSLLTDQNSANNLRTRKRACELIKTGVPPALRGRVWLLLANKHMHPRAGVFASLCKACDVARADPQQYAFSRLIERDLDQCFPRTQPFHGFNKATRDDIQLVLYAYAYYNPEVGYTEGMALIVGLLLMHLQVEDAFWLLDAIVREYDMNQLYAGNMRQLHIDNLVVDELLRLADLPLYEHLRNHHIEPIMFMPGWVLPLFVRTLPWPTLLRVWDFYLDLGHPFLLRTIVAVICLCRNGVLAAPTRSAVLRQLVFASSPPLTPSNVLSRALNLPISNRELHKMGQAAARLVDRSSAPSSKHVALGPKENMLQHELQGKPVSKRTLKLLTPWKK